MQPAFLREGGRADPAAQKIRHFGLVHFQVAPQEQQYQAAVRLLFIGHCLTGLLPGQMQELADLLNGVGAGGARQGQRL